MNRITNNILINMGAEHNASIQQNTIEIQGFSIPLPQVNNFPNVSQVMAATSIFVYNETSTHTEGMETRCPISLEDFVSGDELCEIRNCHHVFKWTHLQSWFSQNSHCPVCRFDIRDHVSN